MGSVGDGYGVYRGISSITSHVFVVHGRNEALRKSMFEFLRSLSLKPIEWEQAVLWTGKASPYIGQVIDAGFAKSRAAVILLSGDDEARLRPALLSASDPSYERELTLQPRPNVFFEAGYAFAKYPDRTLVVQAGQLRPFSDLFGRHLIRLQETPECRKLIAGRLTKAGCTTDTTGTDWLSAGEFAFA